MNCGRENFVAIPECITVSDYTAGILFEDDGIKRNGVVSLMNINSVIPPASAASN